MLERFVKALSLWICLPPLAFASHVVMAEAAVRNDVGTVQAIEIHRAADDRSVNVGMVHGGLADGAIGHHVGSGRGNTAATIAGALGGAVIGNEIEKTQEQGPRYRVTVRIDSGAALIVEETRGVDLRVGDRVRVESNRVYRL
jgi:outer membrane lipoprotein SlyB